jgi:hypothetical protein
MRTGYRYLGMNEKAFLKWFRTMHDCDKPVHGFGTEAAEATIAVKPAGAVTSRA